MAAGGHIYRRTRNISGGHQATKETFLTSFETIRPVVLKELLKGQFAILKMVTVRPYLHSSDRRRKIHMRKLSSVVIESM